MSIDIWHRVTTAMRARFRGGALAQYGAGLHTDCDDCATPPADVVVPSPRTPLALSPQHQTVPSSSAAHV